MWPFHHKSVEDLQAELAVVATTAARAKSALGKYDADNPLVGSIGIMIGFGAAPPGFEEQVRAKQQEREKLAVALRRADEAYAKLRMKTERQLAAIGKSADPAVRQSADEALRRIRGEASPPAVS